MKKIIIFLILAAVVAAAVILLNKPEDKDLQTETKIEGSTTEHDGMGEGSMMDEKNSMEEMMGQNVTEVSMDSFVVFEDGAPKPQFSVKEITAKKGDLIRLKVNVTSGRHDFKLDEFDIYEDTPTGEETTIEFVADKAGEFIYYCNQPGHRANGHWGTLTIIE